jgi:hypothetical protein
MLERNQFGHEESDRYAQSNADDQPLQLEIERFIEHDH